MVVVVCVAGMVLDLVCVRRQRLQEGRPSVFLMCLCLCRSMNNAKLTSIFYMGCINRYGAS
jgi:hypothetical protein